MGRVQRKGSLCSHRKRIYCFPKPKEHIPCIPPRWGVRRCRSYFVSRISCPRRSTIGLWLMDQHQQALVRNILNIEDFLETDLLGDKHPIKITGGALEARKCTDAPPASLGELPLSQEYVAAAQVIAMCSLYKRSAFFPKPGLHRQQPRRQGSTF
ncbi:unnamed protein product [Boreogadus saida]